MTTMSEPWAAFYDGAPQLPGVAPGWLAAARRAEALERAREEREAGERAARIEDRRDAWMHQRMQEYAWRGIPFDPGDMRTLVKSREQLATEVFARQDAEAARADRRALVEAGLLHVLDTRPDEMTSPPVAEGPSAGSPSPPGAASRGVPTMGDPRADQSSAARARRALRRWRAGERRQRFER
jgi:hypothetical protein